jgi:hypothetical protein
MLKKLPMLKKQQQLRQKKLRESLNLMALVTG